MVTLPNDWFSIDPGDKHAAMTCWLRGQPLWTVVGTPSEMLDILFSRARHHEVDEIVYERFALDSRRAAQQAGSEFLTSQMIGVIKWLGSKYDVPTIGYLNHQHKRIYKMGWYKELTLKDKRNLPWWGVGKGEHGKDSWCVGMWHKHVKGHPYEAG